MKAVISILIAAFLLSSVGWAESELKDEIVKVEAEMSEEQRRANHHLALSVMYRQQADNQGVWISELSEMKEDYMARFGYQKKKEIKEQVEKLEQYVLRARENQSQCFEFSKWHRVRAIEIHPDYGKEPADKVVAAHFMMVAAINQRIAIEEGWAQELSERKEKLKDRYKKKGLSGRKIRNMEKEYDEIIDFTNRFKKGLAEAAQWHRAQAFEVQG